MTGDPLDPQQLWQSQKTEHPPMTVAEVQTKAKAFERRIGRRNATEYVACALVVLAFGRVALTGSPWFARAGLQLGWLIQTGSALCVVATLYVAWQLWRRASLGAPLSGPSASIDAYRQALMRQRDALRSVLTWYLAPFIPGMLVLFAGYWTVKPAARLSAQAARVAGGVVHVTTVLVVVICVLTFVVIWLLNQRAADRLQRQIDEL